MKDDPIPPEDHVSRYCRGGSLDNGCVTGASFLLRADEEYVSVNWLEYLQKPNREAQIAEVQRVLTTKLSPGSKAKIAVLNVGETIENVRLKSPDRRTLRVRHRPDEPPEFSDPSHSGIFDTTLDEQHIVELLAEAVRETYPAK